MGFVVMFVMAWLTVFIFYTMDRSLSIMENAFVFLIILTIGINISWVVAEEYKLIEITKDGLLYTGFILYRSIVIPMIFVILFNAIYKVKSTAILSIGVALVTILALNGLMLVYGIVDYKQWNLFYDAIQILFMQAVGFALLKLYRRAIHREVNVS